LATVTSGINRSNKGSLLGATSGATMRVFRFANPLAYKIMR
jgi:hypothetical protein